MCIPVLVDDNSRLGVYFDDMAVQPENSFWAPFGVVDFRGKSSKLGMKI